MTWEIRYSQEAANYLFDNYPYTEALDWALIALLDTEGIPEQGAHQLEPDILMCEIAKHTVIYKRMPEFKRLRILVLKPLEQ